LAHSNQHNFVHYDPIVVIYQGKKFIGCHSTNFLNDNEMLVTLERLHRMYEGSSLAQHLWKFSTPLDRIKYTVSFVERITGLDDFGPYLTALLSLDAFFLNEDRHTNNMAVLYNEKTGEFRNCPIFDNGLALLSDLHDYPLGKDIYSCIKNVCAKPFSYSFIEQIEAANSLYGDQLQFEFTKRDVIRYVNFLNGYYNDNILRRATDVIFEQMRRLSYMLRKHY